MKNKELRINIPEGYIIDEENSTFECIKFKPTNLNYEEVAEKLFADGYYYADSWGNIECHDVIRSMNIYNSNNCVSAEQVEKLLAINKLMNVAKYLNGDWKPNWSKGEYKYYIVITPGTEEIEISYTTTISSELVYFKTEQLALEAIHILGKSTILLALSTDW